jgi:hypothetical protein
MLRTLSALILSVALVPAAALAQNNNRGSEQEQSACRKDVTRLCKAVLDQGDFAVLDCLKANRPKISKACNQVLVSHGQ